MQSLRTIVFNEIKSGKIFRPVVLIKVVDKLSDMIVLQDQVRKLRNTNLLLLEENFQQDKSIVDNELPVASTRIKGKGGKVLLIFVLLGKPERV